MKLPKGVYHVAVISGLIDYFDFDTAVSVLSRARDSLVPGGVVIAANMRRHSLALVMSVLGNWNLVYKEPAEFATLLVERGFC